MTDLDELAAVPGRVAASTAGVPDAALHQPPAAGEWSAAEVLAHLRACGHVWGGVVARMLDEDEPTIRAVSPRSLPLDDTFQRSLDAFTADRAALVRRLTPLDDAQWARGATITGAGAPARKTVQWYVDRLARHERSHIRQLERALGAR